MVELLLPMTFCGCHALVCSDVLALYLLTHVLIQKGLLLRIWFYQVLIVNVLVRKSLTSNILISKVLLVEVLSNGLPSLSSNPKASSQFQDQKEIVLIRSLVYTI